MPIHISYIYRKN